MKSLIYLLIMLAFFSFAGRSQSKSEKRFRKYDIHLITNNEDRISGRLNRITDSAIVIEVSEFNSGKEKPGHTLYTISYHLIGHFMLHNRSGCVRGMGIGMGVGAGLGLLIGDAVGHDAMQKHQPSTSFEIYDPITDYLLIGSVIGMAAGGYLGAGIGSSVNRNFDINGDFEKFLEMKEKMKF